MLIMVVKNFKSKIILAAFACISFYAFSIIPISAADPTIAINISCDKSSLSNGESTDCTISGSTNVALETLSGKINHSTKTTITNTQISDNVTDIGSTTETFSVKPNSTGNFKIATATIKANASEASETIQITNIYFTLPSDPSQKSVNDSNSETIDIKSSDSLLKSLSIQSGENFDRNFQPTVLSYTVTTNSNTITFEAEANSPKAKIEGNGTINNLRCGKNAHTIKVTAEDNKTTTYTISIERSCSANNNLKSLKISAGSIIFKPQTTTYTVNVSNNVSKFTATGYAEDEKATVFYSSAQTINLVTGNKNILKINVQAENGTVRTYTIRINKAGSAEKNDDSSLKSLEVSSGKINFNQDVFDYKITVPYETPSVTVKATPNSEKSSVKISELSELTVGENKSTITVTAENGAVSIYTITIIRLAEGNTKLNNDSSLNTLIVNDQYILVDPNNTTLSITIQNVIQKINVIAIPNQSTSTVDIVSDGDMIGDQDVVHVIVAAEDGSTTTYVLNFSFQYEIAAVDIKEQKPINYILVIVISIAALIVIGVSSYLALITKDNQKNSTKKKTITAS